MTPGFDPDRHHRRSIRLPGHDYCSAGAYFVTFCTYQRELLFDDPILRGVAETMWQRIPRHFPQVELDAWVVMPNHVHAIVVIAGDLGEGEASQGSGLSTESVAADGGGWGGQVVAGEGEASQGSGLSTESVAADGGGWGGQVVAGDASPLQRLRGRPTGAPSGSLGAIAGSYKAVTARRINRLRRTPGAPVWQRNYYEHIIRSERGLNAIRQYIADNPARWMWDSYNPSAAGPDPQAADLWRLLR